MADYSRLPKVIKILNDYQSLINRGSEHGISEGDSFLIFRLGDKVLDPDSGEDLGELELVIGRAVVEHVQAKFSTIKSAEVDRYPGTKKIIRRETGRNLSLAFGLGGSGTEEIEESRPPTLKPLNAHVGDYARAL